jgi:hypothetical protein
MNVNTAFEGLRRQTDWQDAAAHSLSWYFACNLSTARDAVDRLFSMLEDVHYLALVDAHDVPDDMTRFERREYTEDFNGYEEN